jgi:transcriptional regulator with XRE-family HTH domain
MKAAAEGEAETAMLHPGVTSPEAETDAVEATPAADHIEAAAFEANAFEASAEDEASADPEIAVDSEPALAPTTPPGDDLIGGRKLTEARLARGWTIEQVAERILVRPEFLQALEDMNIKILPGKAYALAFLRSYARELGLDEGALVDQFRQESALTREDVNKQIRSPSSRPHRERPWIWAAALVIAAAGFVGWRAVVTHSGSGVSDVAVQAPATSGAGESPSALVAPTRVLEIRAVADAWLEARGPDGTVFLSRTLRAGDVYRPDPSPGWTLHARDGGAFELYVNGRSAGPLGNPGMPVLGRSLDEIEPAASAEVVSPRG